MARILQLANQMQNLLEQGKKADFIGLFAIRLYLAPIFIMAGLYKFNHFDSVVNWFTYLGFPLPALMTFLASSAELVGGFALLIGFATRWASVPLLITMLVAAGTHWDKGWFAIAPGDPATSPAYILEKIGFPGASDSLKNSESVGIRLNKATALLKEHGNYDWLSAKGNFVILNNGIEFAATYFIMLLILFSYGAGNYLSIDYWIKKKFRLQ